MTRRQLSFLTVALSLLMVPVGQALAAGAGNGAAPGTAVHLTPSEKTEIRGLAASALSRVARARKMLADKQNAQASAELRTVSLTLDMVAALRPTGEIKALIDYLRTEMHLGDNQQVLADLLPVYAALDRMASSPIKADARHYLDTVKHSLENDDRPAAFKALDSMSKALTIDKIDFPLAAAREDLRSALNELTGGHVPAAQTDLVSLNENLLRVLSEAK